MKFHMYLIISLSYEKVLKYGENRDLVAKNSTIVARVNFEAAQHCALSNRSWRQIAKEYEFPVATVVVDQLEDVECEKSGVVGNSVCFVS